MTLTPGNSDPQRTPGNFERLRTTPTPGGTRTSTKTGVGCPAHECAKCLRDVQVLESSASPKLELELESVPAGGGWGSCFRLFSLFSLLLLLPFAPPPPFTCPPVVYCPPRFSTGFSIVSDSQGATDFVSNMFSEDSNSQGSDSAQPKRVKRE